jgi:mannosyltransferase OCH1-like enzyme
MKLNYENLQKENPEINFHFYDEEMCREFIKNNFDISVVNAYNSLIPCSYKSDLWRFCVLYVNGGIYLDIKYKCINGFKFISLTEQEWFVVDRPDNCVYTALIVTLPKNEIMLKCIKEIVKNVKNKYYGKCALSPTGPRLLGKFFNESERNKLSLKFRDAHVENVMEKYYISKDDIIILTYYDDYRKEQKIYQKNKYYSELWNNKNIYIK